VGGKLVVVVLLGSIVVVVLAVVNLGLSVVVDVDVVEDVVLGVEEVEVLIGFGVVDVVVVIDTHR